jgi:protein TonB
VGVDALDSRDCFAVTLGLDNRDSSTARWFCAPLGAAIHAVALVALALAALWAPIADMPPRLPPLVLQLAPPPPQPSPRGRPAERSGAKAPTESEFAIDPSEPRFVPRIEDAVLQASFDAPRGQEDGFEIGFTTGMDGGIPGGVVGGVPGGLVGGVVSGLGTELPRFPKPDVGPSPIRMPQPSYTREAIRDNVTGAVVLRVVIDEQGRVEVLKVLRSIPELDEEAIRVVEARWRFQPATKNGRPVPTLSDLVVRFHLY